ncbi:methylated-DNA--[protein]-cysteine S-methyltransferase [Listeria rocourtiae]|uniref:methylated-DNA--[protein]-cysteine S-methyltransferase n=1 Tax=Listeria rocourtiae TaxID=647910 RepID=UPI003D2F940E
MKPIFYDRLDVAGMAIYVGVSERGLAFVGSDGADLLEMENWSERVRVDLTADAEKVRPYADGIVGYLTGMQHDFGLPVDISGTPFQEAVWKALLAIPYGETRTYSEIANLIGKPKAVRAVGTAIGVNPVLMVVPCHRVIGKNGNITGYRGGIAMKERLLQLETTGA